MKKRFTEALVALLDKLATEENKLTQEDRSGPGFTLELSASSPADGFHGFRDFRLSEAYEELRRRNPHQPDEPFQDFFYFERQRIDPDEEYFEFNHQLVPRCTAYHKVADRDFDRVLGGRPLELGTANKFQPPFSFRVVKMVTGLLTRRQYYRSVSVHVLSFLMQNCFPSIVNLRIERWQAARLRHPGAQTFLEELIHCSRELKSFHFFEDRSTYHEVSDPYSPLTDTGVIDTLWRICQFPKLQNFSACSVIDASDFFSRFTDSITKEGPWPELKTVCLTAQRLMPTNSWMSDFSIPNQTQAWRVLTDATKIANLMPRLEVIELWHTEDTTACIWTYYKTEYRARLIIRGGSVVTAWHMQPHRLLLHMAETWANYASNLLDTNITCDVFMVPENFSYFRFSSYAMSSYCPCDMVQYLELANIILHPSSLQQMKWETLFELYPHPFKVVSEPIYMEGTGLWQHIEQPEGQEEWLGDVMRRGLLEPDEDA